ncbi:MAG: ATPase, T2SS/T4P/T4SS family, partial [Planctomycetota bacterium]|jgi:type II secretory pathway component PulF
MHAAVVSRAKVMGKMDVAEKRIPQEGRIRIVAERREIDLRVSSMPTLLGEKMVIRILDKENLSIRLEELGFRPEGLAAFQRILRQPHGIGLVTGPTGSGKTTTLYSALDLLRSPELNIITVEDPVEYQLDLINQVQVHEAIGLTFAKILRSVLRQDPDVIMVGEIRDEETARVAVQAALTGHLVLATLHTNDAPGATARLLDMGIEAYLLSGALNGAVAQRLVRTVCDGCATKYYPAEQVLKDAGLADKGGMAFTKGAGCERCHNSGYRGRAGIYEIMEVTDDIRRLIHRASPTHELRATLREQRVLTLREEGVPWSKQPGGGAQGDARRRRIGARRDRTADRHARCRGRATEGRRMKLAYQAIDQSGREVSDQLEAAGIAEAGEELRQRGLYVTSVSEVSSPPPATRRPRAAGLRGRRLKDLALFSRQLALLVRTGTPLADALGAMVRQLPAGPWRAVVADLQLRVEEGVTLSDAMESHPGYFDQVCLSLVAAGESSGQLDQMLDRFAHLTRQQLKIWRTVTGAMIYPAVLAVVGVAVVVLMLGFVLPRFTGLFETLDAPLPPTTKGLITLSDSLRSTWWAYAAVMLGFVIGAVFLLASPAGRRFRDRTLVQIPWLGGIARDLLTARFTRLLGVLLGSQIPMLEALSITRRSTGNSRYAELVEQAEESVVRGEALSGVLSQSPLISPYVAEAVRHGERSGHVSPVLLEMAEFLDEENEALVQTLTRLIEPFMLIVLGIIVAVIAVSLFMPLFDLTSLTTGR